MCRYLFKLHVCVHVHTYMYPLLHKGRQVFELSLTGSKNIMVRYMCVLQCTMYMYMYMYMYTSSYSLQYQCPHYACITHTINIISHYTSSLGSKAKTVIVTNSHDSSGTIMTGWQAKSNNTTIWVTYCFRNGAMMKYYFCKAGQYNRLLNWIFYLGYCNWKGVRNKFHGDKL